jgi:hypothetical protein
LMGLLLGKRKNRKRIILFFIVFSEKLKTAQKGSL